MKAIAVPVAAVLFVIASTGVYAAECAEGARGAACAGPNGAAAVHTRGGTAYHAPATGAAVAHPATPYHAATGAVATPNVACARGVYREGCVAR